MMRWHSLGRTAFAGLMGLFALCAHAQQPSNAIQDITARLRANDGAGALEISKRALLHDPHDCRILSLQALAYTQLGQPDGALQSFHQSLKFCPRFLPALEGAAQISFAKGLPDAEALLGRIIDLQPQNPTAQGMLATLLSRKGDCKAALPHLQAIEATFSSQPYLRYSYGQCLAQTGSLSGAIEQFKALSAEHPSDAATYDLAVLQLQNHEADSALAALEPLLKQGTFAPALELASSLAESKGDTPRAVELARAAIVLQPDNAEYYLQFAKLAFEHNSHQVGIDMLNAGLSRQPNSAELYLARGVLEAQISKQPEALADFQKAHQLDPRLSLTEDAIGIVQTQAHEGKVPLQFYRDQAKQHPKDALLQYLLAEQASQGEESEALIAEAIEAGKRAETLDPHSLPTHDLLAKLYVRSGKPELSIVEAERALAEDPDDQEALFQELMATRRTGARDKIPALSKRLEEARKRNAAKLQENDRFRLVEATGGQP